MNPLIYNFMSINSIGPYFYVAVRRHSLKFNQMYLLFFLFFFNSQQHRQQLQGYSCTCSSLFINTQWNPSHGQLQHRRSVQVSSFMCMSKIHIVNIIQIVCSSSTFQEKVPVLEEKKKNKIQLRFLSIDFPFFLHCKCKNVSSDFHHTGFPFWNPIFTCSFFVL